MVDITYGYVGVFRQYGWKKVTLIVQEENLFTEVLCVLASLQLVATVVVKIGLSIDDKAAERLVDERRY